MNLMWVGIDMASCSFTASVRDRQAQKNDYLGVFMNTQDGFTRLSKQLQERQTANQAIRLVVEATGGYEKRLCAYANKQDWGVCMPNALLVRDFARSLGQRNKNDREDANMLAQYGAHYKIRVQLPLPEEISQLAQLQQRRQQLEKQIRQERCRLAQFANQPNPNTVVSASFEATIKCLTSELTTIEDAIKALLNAHPHHKSMVKRLRTAPGVGPKNSIPLLIFIYRYLARSGEIASYKGVVAFCGLDPKERSSGKGGRPTTISKMGDSTMRNYLYMGALGGVRGNNALRHFYNRLVERGKPKRLALVAAARKILVWAFTLFINETDFDPSKHPIPVIAS